MTCPLPDVDQDPREELQRVGGLGVGAAAHLERANGRVIFVFDERRRAESRVE